MKLVTLNVTVSFISHRWIQNYVYSRLTVYCAKGGYVLRFDSWIRHLVFRSWPHQM